MKWIPAPSTLLRTGCAGMTVGWIPAISTPSTWFDLSIPLRTGLASLNLRYGQAPQAARDRLAKDRLRSECQGRRLGGDG